MRKAAFFMLILVPATAAYANPCIESPTSIAAGIVVVLAALCLEAFIMSGVLLFSGMAAVPTFVALAVGNVGSYLGILLPLAYYFEVHIVVLEVVVIAVEMIRRRPSSN
jgi:hypothetical protein